MHLRELRRHAGRFVVVGFAGHSLSDDVRRFAAEFDLAGIIYKPDNVLEPTQIAEVSRECRALTREWPLWIAIEQEGRALPPPFTAWPDAAVIGRCDDEALVDRYATALAAELVEVGINLNFGPVLDIVSTPNRMIAPERAFGDGADLVASRGRSIVRAWNAAGVSACVKHFPGCGRAVSRADDWPLLDEDPVRLRAVDALPFAAAIDARAAGVLIADAVVPAIDEAQPASMSKTMSDAWLKQDLAFGGVAFARASGREGHAPAVDRIAAGCDVLLMDHETMEEQVATIESIIRAAETTALSGTRLDDAWKRQRMTKEHAPRRDSRRQPTELIGSLTHQLVAEQLRRWQ